MSSVLPDSLADGRFKLLEVIGEGGMATVYRAYDQRLQRPRAIKVLSPNLATRPSLRKRFLAEAQTMATLEESRVVRVFDMGEDGERVFIVMELVEGGSLLDRLRAGGALPPRMAAQVALQLCESLQAAHDAGVIHRDIKPHNILLTGSGEIRVTDFGIAQVQNESQDGLTKTGAVMGTWGFMAPEQKSNAKSVDARADVYSVGATLWALLKNDTPPELFMADSAPEMHEGIPDALAEVVKRATRYRREERYPSVRAMGESLRAMLALLPEDPPDAAPLVRPRAEEPRARLDTLAQFSEPPSGGGSETMVPDAPAFEHPVRAEHPAPPSADRETLVFDEPLPPPPPPRSRAAVSWPMVGAAVAVVAALAVGWAVFGRPDAPVSALPEPPPPGTPVVAVAPPSPSEAATLPAAVGPSGVVPAAPGTAPAASPPAAPSAAPAAAPPSAVPPSAAPVEPAAALPSPAPDAPAAAPPPAVDPSAPAEAAPAVVDAAPVEAPRAPTLGHTPPAAAVVGQSVTFSAAGPPASATVTLFYRVRGGTTFSERPMKAAGGTFTTSLKVDASMAPGLQYFLKATSGSTVLWDGKPTAPHALPVQAEAPAPAPAAE